MPDIVSSTMRTPKLARPAGAVGGDTLAFFEVTGDSHDLLLFDCNEMERIQVETDSAALDTVRWAPDGETLYFTTADTVAATNLRGETWTVLEVGSDCRLWDVSPDGTHLYYSAEKSLWRYRLRTETAERILPGDDGAVLPGGGGCGPDGERIVYATERSDSEHPTTRIADADGQNCRELLAGAGELELSYVDWHPDGSRLLVTTPERGDRFGEYDLSAESIEWIRPRSNADITPVAYLPTGDGILATRSVKLTQRPVVRERDGTIRSFDMDGTTRFDGGAHGTAVGEKLALVPRETPARPREVLGFDATTGERELCVEPDTDESVSNGFVAPRDVRIDSPTGDELVAHCFDAGARPSPVVVQVYGAQPEWEPYFRPRTQYLVRKGFTVLQAEQPASAFTDAEHENHAAVGRWLRDQPWVDEERIVVFEHSHGGYDTYMQLVRYPEVWTAGIASSGATDLLAFYENAGEHHRGWLEEHLGNPGENRDAYQRQSPLTHVESFEGPLLMVHGADDWLSVSHARRFREALLEQGYSENDDFEFVELDGQGHVPGSVAEKIEKWHVIDDFLERRVLT